jgi:hypothetical protein
MKMYYSITRVKSIIVQALEQCDQIGQDFAIWVTLGKFLPNQILPKQAVSTHILLKVF